MKDQVAQPQAHNSAAMSQRKLQASLKEHRQQMNAERVYYQGSDDEILEREGPFSFLLYLLLYAEVVLPSPTRECSRPTAASRATVA